MGANKLSTEQEDDVHNPLNPALAAFAGGLPFGVERIKALGLSVEEAKKLCVERQKTLTLRKE